MLLCLEEAVELPACIILLQEEVLGAVLEDTMASEETYHEELGSWAPFDKLHEFPAACSEDIPRGLESRLFELEHVVRINTDTEFPKEAVQVDAVSIGVRQICEWRGAAIALLEVAKVCRTEENDESALLAKLGYLELFL